MSLLLLPAELFAETIKSLRWWDLTSLARTCRSCLCSCQPRLRDRRHETRQTPEQIKSLVRGMRSAKIFYNRLVSVIARTDIVSARPTLIQTQHRLLDKYNPPKTTVARLFTNALHTAIVMENFGNGVILTPLMRLLTRRHRE